MPATHDDPLSRFSALAMLLGVIVLLFIAGQSRQPQAAAASRSGPVLAATPRIVMVVQTAQPLPTPTATAAPEPTQAPVVEPQIIVQYVEVVAPATVAPPTPFPTVSHTKIHGWVEMPRPPVFEAEPVRRPGDMPEAVAP